MARSESSVLRQAVTVVAIGLAVYAQSVVRQGSHEARGWWLFALAALLAAAVAGRRATVVAPADVAPAGAPGVFARAGFALAAVAACAATTYASTMGWHPVAALVLWGASFVLAALAVRRWALAPPTRPHEPWSAAEVGAVAALLVLAALARTLWIESLPRAYFGDEPRVAMFLFNAYGGGRIPNFFSMGWNTWPVVGLSLEGLFAPWLGIHMTTLRLSSALLGTLGVLTTYLLARELGGRRLALLAAFLFAVGRTAIDFSRVGIAHSQVLFFEPLALFFWWRAVNGGRAMSYLWAGIATGWCLYSYNAGQLVPPLLFGWMAVCAVLAPRRALHHWRGAALALAGFALTLFPYGFYFTDHFTFGPNWSQWTIMARNRQTMSRVMEAWQASGFDAAAPILWRQVWTTWLGFGVLPGAGYTLGYRRGGMLDDLSAPLFVLGLAMSLRRLRGARDAFVPYWWLLTVIAGGIMTIDPPSFVRMVGLLPAVAILAALPLEWVTRTAAGPATQIVGLVLALGLAGGAAWENWRTYFVEFAASRADPVSELTRYLMLQPADRRAVLLGSEHFLYFKQEIFDIEFPGRLRDVPDPAHFLPIHEPVDQPLLLIFGPTQHTLADYAQALYPDAPRADVTGDFGGQPVFRAIEITPEQARRRAGLALALQRHDGTSTPAGVADPFAAEARAADGAERLVWSGSLYWSARRAATLTFEAAPGAVLRLGDLDPFVSDGRPVSRTIDLARGWQPVRIEEPAARARPVSLTVGEQEHARAVTRWDLRPEAEPEGLVARYVREGRPIDAIDPQLNAFAVEDRFHPGNDPLVRMPFSASWRGALRVDTAGTYQFEAVGSGPYSVRLDGAEILHGAPEMPEQPLTTRAALALDPGLHPIAVEFDSTVPAHTRRRLFQLFWTPPGGSKQLIPPANFVRTGGTG